MTLSGPSPLTKFMAFVLQVVVTYQQLQENID
jgi:hypothetical protein